MNNISGIADIGGGLLNKSIPLISFHSLVDEDMGLVKNIIINYRNPKIFNLDMISKLNYMELLGLVYKREDINPLYCIANKDTDKSFLDRLYDEFIESEEREVLKYSVGTEMINVISTFYESSGDILPSILYYSDEQKRILNRDKRLSKINSVSIETLLNNPDKLDGYTQYYFKYKEELDPFEQLKKKTFYFSTIGCNLFKALIDGSNTMDLKIDNDRIKKLYFGNNKISLFDLYKNEFIGRYNNE